MSNYDHYQNMSPHDYHYDYHTIPNHQTPPTTAHGYHDHGPLMTLSHVLPQETQVSQRGRGRGKPLPRGLGIGLTNLDVL